MIGIVAIAIGAAVIAWALGRLLLIERPITAVVIPSTVPAFRRKSAGPTSAAKRAPFSVSSLRFKAFVMPQFTFARKTSTRKQHVQPLAPKSRRRLRLPRFAAPTIQLPQLRLPQFKLRLPTFKRAGASPETNTQVPATGGDFKEAPAIPSWLLRIGKHEMHPLQQRVLMCWMYTRVLSGDALEDFLRDVEASDPELNPVTELARREQRPLVLRSLAEAEQWNQKISLQNNFSAA